MNFIFLRAVVSFVLFTSLLGCNPKEGPRGLRVGDELVVPFMGIVTEFEGTPTMVVTKITKDRVEISKLGRVINNYTYEEIEYLFDQGKLGNLTEARKANVDKKNTED